ncbi:hypothetical protein EPN96_04900 [bacterium]|nr:MAG: hypothetical protein EPN96_04900 [bacterium]
MADYTFSTLSPIDFENMVRDLIQSERSIRLESFKSGKDDGIDFRCSKCNDSILIVQAKHYSGTNFRRLLADLKIKEKPKIDKLKPNKYLIATSVSLSPANKETIRSALFPHIKVTEDIYGREDLNNLLGLFPDIERQHFKLWLSGTSILEEVLHSRILNQTRIALQDISDKAQLYVVNNSFGHALQVLKDHNYVIIAGIPGIGKTTLAKMLVLHYLRADYDFINVSYDIEEAYSIPDRKRPRVYLYDDFLGRTSLEEKLRKNEDHRLISFINSVMKTKTAKLILTTREYILHQAQATYEMLNSPIFNKPQCIVDLSQYTQPIRAQILYNHLYFSRLPSKYVEEIVRQETYLKIIDHKNYSPRIVEYMTDPMWVSPSEASEYPGIFIRNLNKPFLIWEQAFNSHLSSMAREMLIVLGTLPKEVFVEDLKLSTNSFILNKGMEFSEREFRRALSELQGNFIVLSQDFGNDIVAFHNPSVQDFIENYFDKNPEQYSLMLQAACFFEQVKWACTKIPKIMYVRKLQHEIETSLKNTFSVKPCAVIIYSSDNIGKTTYKDRDWLKYEYRLKFIASLCSEKEFAYIKIIFREMLCNMAKDKASYDLSPCDLYALVEHVLLLNNFEEINTFLLSAKESLFRKAYWITDVTYIIKLMKLQPHIFQPYDRDRILSTIQHIVCLHLDEDDAQSLQNDLSELREINDIYGFDLRNEIDKVTYLLSCAEEKSEQESDNYTSSYNDDRKGDFMSKDSIRDMYLTLLR